MARILTFLGKDDEERRNVAYASAQKLALLGNRVLLVGQGPSTTWSKLLGVTPAPEPQVIGSNLSVVHLETTFLLEKAWEEIKALERQYLRSPILNNVYGQELGILPGMDDALALNVLREYDGGGSYDVIVYDGSDSFNTIRMFGIPEILSWYFRRFQKVLSESDLFKTLSPFVQPIASTILNVSWSFENLTPDSSNRANQIITDGLAAIADPQRISAYLVVEDQTEAIALAQYLWGSAQQVGLTVAGVLVNQSEVTETLVQAFSPLPLNPIPHTSNSDWQVMIDALPDFITPKNTPIPLKIDVAAREIRAFLPGFDKKEVKLTQSGPEITIDAGNQRRNIILPPPLAGKPVKGAKFDQGYLIISL
ncbi:ArsA family ATPase [Gloeocapsa sp. PCC 73106]|uniref:Get3/ArsA fold putative tail anchor-mediating ATPase NosAFP n=1 Tax=Gloeocapsa sp. PCC 73106 TaxID=102232 RepID=UPI0002AB9AA0|nr:ArsA family ATPase [Gloeocapsa sp. PCC 73106]ELR97480.1 oxyanion-translocating ATPase [Gloeocapsa sp. PCC 73106]